MSNLFALLLNTLRMLLELILSLFLLCLLLCSLFAFVPGQIGMDGDPGERQISPLVTKTMENNFSLQAPPLTKAIFFFKSILFNQGGESYLKRQPVMSIVLSHFSQSLRLAFPAIIFILLVVSLQGYLWTKFKDIRFRSIVLRWNQIFMSVPSIILGPFLLYLFSIKLNWLPSVFLTSPAHLILPIVTLCMRPIGQLTQVWIQSLSEIEQLDFVLFAKAKGLGVFRIFFIHMLPHSISPVLGYLPNLLVSLASGSFLVEYLFSIPGSGLLFFRAIEARDLNLILGLSFFYGGMLIIISKICLFIQKHTLLIPMGEFENEKA